MGRVVHFEIAADDPDRAAEFYRKSFGWDVADWGAPARYLLVTTGTTDKAGINGAITARHEHVQSTVNTIDVENWERAAGAIEAAGGEVLTEKSAINGVGFFAYCRDTEGNIFGILESNPVEKPSETPVKAGRSSS